MERISTAKRAVSKPEGGASTFNTPSSTSPRRDVGEGTAAPLRINKVAGSPGTLIAAVVGNWAVDASQKAGGALESAPASPTTTLSDTDRGKGKPSGAPRSTSSGAATRLACTVKESVILTSHLRCARNVTSSAELWARVRVPSGETSTAISSDEVKATSASAASVSLAQWDQRRPEAHSMRSRVAYLLTASSTVSTAAALVDLPKRPSTRAFPGPTATRRLLPASSTRAAASLEEPNTAWEDTSIGVVGASSRKTCNRADAPWKTTVLPGVSVHWTRPMRVTPTRAFAAASTPEVATFSSPTKSNVAESTLATTTKALATIGAAPRPPSLTVAVRVTEVHRADGKM
eukprot:scaffold92027_cov26-Tisochrysis_lutea.AAC.3